MQTFRLITATLLVAGWFSTDSGIARAQYSESFQREGASLRWDVANLTKKKIDLQLRSDALKIESGKLQGRADAIRKMPAGIGRSAAIKEYKRDLDAFNSRRDEFQIAARKFKEDVATYRERKKSYDRRVGAAKSANAYQIGDRVRVEWRGKWWDAVVSRAENGSYYIRYVGYGSEWNEWVGGNRIRRR